MLQIAYLETADILRSYVLAPLYDSAERRAAVSPELCRKPVGTAQQHLHIRLV